MLYSKTNLISSKVIIIIIIIIVIIAFLIWLFIESSKPLPGQKIADLGRGHIPTGEKVEYNSNPPTSGKHYEDWVRAGVYETTKDDGNLVHSLEHGYVVMSYRCNPPVILGRDEGATPESKKDSGPASQGEQARMTSTDSSPAAQNDNDGEIATPSTIAQDRNDECEERKNQLSKVYEKKGKRKLIVVPRGNLDTSFALTAWTYIDKFDPSTSSGLSVSDMERIEKFIDAHRDQGPERTME